MEKVIKLILNSVYGKFGQRLFEQTKFYTKETLHEFKNDIEAYSDHWVSSVYHKESGLYEASFKSQ